MRIQFERSGGFTGMTQTAWIDTADLSRSEALTLLELVEDARLFEWPEATTENLQPDTTPMPDSIQCTITIEIEGFTYTLDFDEESAPEEAQPLLRKLSLLARQPAEPADH